MIMAQIEAAAEELINSGACEDWFSGADDGVRKVLGLHVWHAGHAVLHVCFGSGDVFAGGARC